MHRERYLHDLLDAGANANATDELGDFPLLVAAERNNTAGAAILLNAKADINKKAADGMTPLLTAVSRQNVDVLENLLLEGADVTIQNNKGESAASIVASAAVRNPRIADALEAYTDTGSTRAGAIGAANPLQAVRQAIQNELCTFTGTGPEFVKQKWWQCMSCSTPAAPYGVCESCQACHKGHQMRPMGIQKFYCDCGPGDACACLTPARGAGAAPEALEEYRRSMDMALFDGEISAKEADLLRSLRDKLGVTDEQHQQVLAGYDLTLAKFNALYVDSAPAAAAEDASEVMTVLAKEALVVGNSKYVQPGASLKNPYNDATRVASTLRELGFNVEVVLDIMNYEQWAAAVGAFVARLKKHEKQHEGCVGFFYFAGHAIELKGCNYLMHGEFTSDDLAAQGFEAKSAMEDTLAGYMSSQAVLQSMEDACNTCIMVLDACRNNPFKPAPKLKRRGKGSSGGGAAKKPSGLAAIYPTGSSMIVLSAAPGFTAGDGSDENKDNGMFTNSLLKYLPRRDLHIDEVIFNVSRDVYAVSKGKQHPWKHSSLLKRVYLGRPIGK
jgi:hypothetical protein